VIKFSFLFLFQLIFAVFVTAQSVDSLLKQPDSSHHQVDTVSVNNPADTLWREALKDSAWKFVAVQFPGKNFIVQAYQKNSFFGFRAQPVFIR